jgi:hypothetical protein
MNMVDFLYAVGAWLSANPWVWPFVVSLIATVLKLGDKYPRVKALRDMLKAVGFDEAWLIDSAKRFVTGKFPQPKPALEAKSEPKVDLENSK